MATVNDTSPRPAAYYRAVATIWIRLLGSFPIAFAIILSLFLARSQTPPTFSMWRLPIVCTLAGIVVWLFSGSLARRITRHREP
jgi:hypothetical protein